MVEIEARLAGMQLSATSKDETTDVVGGMLDTSNARPAIEWVSAEMTKAGINGVIDVYRKGPEVSTLNGMVFVKFVSLEKRTAAIQKFNSIKASMLGKTNFMNPERPVQERVAKKFLDDMKNLMVTWKYEKPSLSFDDESMVFSVIKSQILKAIVRDYQFKVEWLDSSWGQWSLLTEDEKFKEIVGAAQHKLNEALQRLDKGKGKGVNSA